MFKLVVCEPRSPLGEKEIAMYQKVIIAGNLGNDPSMRYTQDGTPVTSFSVAVNTGYGENKGTIWFRVSAWRKQAEICNQYLSKGRQVLVEGRLVPDPANGGPRIWSGQDGQPRASFELTAENVRFIGGRGPDAGGDAGEGGLPANEDELPF
jgi:single-strand DNA-binding protein